MYPSKHRTHIKHYNSKPKDYHGNGSITYVMEHPSKSREWEGGRRGASLKDHR